MWKGVLAEIDLLIDFESKKLRVCRPEDLSAIQMKIAAYESVKNIPQNVVDRDES